MYEGYYLKGKPHGVGRLINAAGDIYLGGLNQGLYDGPGIHTYPNGDKYIGDFVAGKK